MDGSTLDQIFYVFFDEKSILVLPSVDILLTGGEPTLNADPIRYTMQKVSKEEVTFCITTVGDYLQFLSFL